MVIGRNWVKKSLTFLGVVILLLSSGCASDGGMEKSTNSFSSVQQSESLAYTSNEGAATQDTTVAGGTAPAEAPGAAVNSAAQSGFSMATAAEGDQGLNRKLIYKGSLAMRVANYAEAQAAIRDRVVMSGGYILSFSENTSSYEQGGEFTLKVPSSGFSSFMKSLESIPNLGIQRSMQAQDVSEEYVDLEARLNAKQVLEARYLEFMQKAQKTDDLVKFTNELGQIQEEIERIKGRMRYINQNVAYSTIELRVYQPMGTEEPKLDELTILQKAGNAMSSSYRVLTQMGEGIVIALAALLPILIAALIIGLPFYLIFRKVSTGNRARLEQERLKRTEYNQNMNRKNLEPEVDEVAEWEYEASIEEEWTQETKETKETKETNALQIEEAKQPSGPVDADRAPSTPLDTKKSEKGD